MLDGATLADFNETAAKMQMAAEINQASITADDITLNVTVGSLIVTGEVRTNDANAADVALQALTSIMTNATEVQSTFGLPLVEVTALPTLSYVAKPPMAPPPSPPPAGGTLTAIAVPPPSAPPPSAPSSAPDMTIIIIAAAVGGGVCLLCVLAGVACLLRARKKKKAIDPAEPTEPKPKKEKKPKKGKKGKGQDGAAVDEAGAAEPSNVSTPRSRSSRFGGLGGGKKITPTAGPPVARRSRPRPPEAAPRITREGSQSHLDFGRGCSRSRNHSHSHNQPPP